MSVVVHHLEKSRSHRVLWLLEELEVEYSIVEHKRHPKTMRAMESLTKLHPLGKAPLVELAGDVLAESGAIAEDLCERFGPTSLLPEAGTEARRRVRYWLHYAEGSLMTPLLVLLITEQIRNGPVPFFLRPITRAVADKIDGNYTRGELTKHSAWIEQTLAESPYFAGDELSLADIQMSYPIEAASARSDVVGPNARTWLAKVRQRPAYQRALDKGGEPGAPG